MVNYKFVTRLSDKLVVLTSAEYGNQVWTACKIRLNKKCYITGENLKGKEAFRPTGSEKNNRMERLSSGAIKALEL